MLDIQLIPLYIFNRENPQNSEPQNGSRRGLDFIALEYLTRHFGERTLVFDAKSFLLISGTFLKEHN